MFCQEGRFGVPQQRAHLWQHEGSPRGAFPFGHGPRSHRKPPIGSCYPFHDHSGRHWQQVGSKTFMHSFISHEQGASNNFVHQNASRREQRQTMSFCSNDGTSFASCTSQQRSAICMYSFRRWSACLKSIIMSNPFGARKSMSS